MTDSAPAPRDATVRMPAEWEAHQATWMAWPHNRDTWPHNLAEAQSEFVDLVRVIAEAETVCLIASGEALRQARAALAPYRQVEFFDIPTNDAWIRDYGPTFVVGTGATRSLAAVDWRYNGWGEKYPPFDDDRRAATRIAHHLGVPCRSSSWVVEGGAIEINRRGDLLTTISCLLNPNRNPLPTAEFEATTEFEATVDQFHSRCSEHLSAMCGAASVCWLTGAELAGDDTDGHIDQQVRFLEDDLLAVARGFGPEDPQDETLRRNIAELKEVYAGARPGLQAVDLPVPRPAHAHGQRLPASYANFYLCNRGIIVPQFGDRSADERAMSILQAATGRDVFGLPSVNLVSGLGSVHCLTQQQPESGGPVD